MTTTRDPRWENVTGGIVADDIFPDRRRLEVEVRLPHHTVVGFAFYLDGLALDKHAELAKHLNRGVRSIDKHLEALG